MTCRMEDLRCKDIINVKDGMRIGCVDDVIINTCSAQVESLVVYGRKKCFGLFGREPDIIICWKDINMIGEDTILVCFQPSSRPCRCKKQRGFLANLFE